MKKFVFVLLLFGLFLLNPKIASAQSSSCGLAKIEEDDPLSDEPNWNVTYCVSNPTKGTIESIQSVTATCRRAPIRFDDLPIINVIPVIGDIEVPLNNCSCHEDNWYDIEESLNPGALAAKLACKRQPAATTSQSTPVISEILQDENGDFYSCYTLTSLDRNMGLIEVSINDTSGNLVCKPPRTEVTPNNYGWIDYLEATLDTRFDIGFGGDGVDVSSPCSGGLGIETAIGCIPVLSDDPNAFLGFIITWAIGIGGGIAFLLIVFAGFQIMTSTGNPERLKGGQQLLTSAIAGLILLVFALFVLRVIGVDILKIPGFGK